MRRHALFAATLLIASLPSGAARAEDDPHAGCVAPPSYVPAVARAAAAAASRRRQLARDRHHRLPGGAGLLRPGAQLRRVVRVDRGGPVVPPGVAARSEARPGVRRPEPRPVRARQRQGGEADARAEPRRSAPAPPTASGAASRSARSSWTRSTASRTRRRSPRTRRRSTTRSWPTWAIRSCG